MIEGIFGTIEHGHAKGWAYDKDGDAPVEITIKLGDKIIAQEKADIYRADLLSIAPKETKGNVGFYIKLPKRIVNWNRVKVYGNGKRIPLSPQMRQKVNMVRRSLRLEMAESPAHYFIHIPKTAGTAFKVLLEEQYDEDQFFPSRRLVKENNGLYPLFHQIIKSKQPEKPPVVFLGHYPFAARETTVQPLLKSVIFRDPLERAISNIFHMKNNDKRMKDLTPEQIYHRGSWNYVNLQVRYMTDPHIDAGMQFIHAGKLDQYHLQSAIKNMRQCQLVGISEDLDRTVKLANTLYGWSLPQPQKVNIARSKKTITDRLRNKIKADNALDFKLYAAAKRRFENLCKKHLD